MAGSTMADSMMADSTMAAGADLSRGSVLLSLSLATAGFALATTFVRFYARRGIDGGLRGDDYVSGVATVSYSQPNEKGKRKSDS